MRLPDPSRTQLVLVGVSNYDLLPGLPAVSRNVDALSRLFTDPTILGIPPENCQAIKDPGTMDEVLGAVHRAAEAAGDTLIVYFAGHGVLDGQTAELHLCLPGGDSSNLHKAVRYADLRRIVLNAEDCGRKVVILDCCHSGSAIGAMSDGQTHIADQSRIEGTYVMTSTSPYNAAMAPVDAEYTAFTGELITAIATGLPHATSLIDVDALYFHVRTELSAKNYPIPHQRSRNEGRKIVLVRNRFGNMAPTPPKASDIDLPDVPAGLEPALWMAPAELAAQLVELRQTEPPTADALLDAVAVRRPDQEVAALVGVLAESGRDAEADRLLMAATLRPQEDVALLLAALREMELIDQTDTLLRFLVDSERSAVAAHAAELRLAREHDLVRRLLDMTVRRSTDATTLVGLITALWAVGLRDEVDALLERNAAAFSADQVVELGDALRVAGREEEAFKLYARAVEKVANREAREVASLVEAMRKAGHDSQADDLLEAAATLAQGDPTRGFELFESLQAADEDAAGRMLSWWRPAAADEVGTLARLLRGARHYQQALAVCVRAATELSGADVLQLIERLRSEGRPIDAHRVLEAAGSGLADPGGLVDLLAELHRLDRGADFDRVTAGVSAPETANAIVSGLHTAGCLGAAAAFVAASQVHQGSLKALIAKDGAALAATLESLNPVLAAQLLDEVGAVEARKFLLAVRYESAAEIIAAATSAGVSAETSNELVDFLTLRDRQRILRMLAPKVLGRLTVAVPASKAATMMALVPPETAVATLLCIPVEAAAEVLAATEPAKAYRMLVAVQNSKAAAWLAAMPTQPAAVLLATAQAERIAQWLALWPPADVGSVLLVLPAGAGAQVLSAVEAGLAARWLQGLGSRARPLFAGLPWSRVAEIRHHLDLDSAET
ncbi:caspase, EACC1-associated type [Micromonospora sp. CA-244673]|uniref:caspase family protein n=1 Tax=Micromonospora sp. CA-244673 TaxID=3239958 RepID=UPI003D91E977